VSRGRLFDVVVEAVIVEAVVVEAVVVEAVAAQLRFTLHCTVKVS
jgi:hypothetical protein